MLVGPGIQEVCKKIKNKRRGWVFFLVIFLNFIPGYGQVLSANRDAPLEHQRRGEWIRDHIDKPQIIMGSDKLPCFYAGKICGRFVWMGPTMDELENGVSFEEILQRRGVSLVIADIRFMSHWTKYHFLFEDKVPANLKRLADLSDARERIILYQYQPSS